MPYSFDRIYYIEIVPIHIFNKIIYLYTCACLISSAQNCVYKFLVTPLGKSLPLISSLQERIFNKLSMSTRRNMITIVVSKSNKATDSSRRHTIEDSSTPPLKKKSIAELYTQTKPILKLMSTSNAKGHRSSLLLE